MLLVRYRPGMDTFDREIELASDPWLGWARTVLQLGGAAYLLFALLGGPLTSMQVWLDPNMSTAASLVVTLVTSLVFLVICLPLSIAQFAAASGLGSGRKWAWILGLIFGVLYLPSCTCLPFGAVILFGLLNGKTRALFT